MQRVSLRLDGFVTMHAPYGGGELVTKPLVFAGQQLVINYSTSAAGDVRVESQNSDGTAIPGYALAEAGEIYGDQIEPVVAWEKG